MNPFGFFSEVPLKSLCYSGYEATYSIRVRKIVTLPVKRRTMARIGQMRPAVPSGGRWRTVVSIELRTVVTIELSTVVTIELKTMEFVGMSALTVFAEQLSLAVMTGMTELPMELFGIAEFASIELKPVEPIERTELDIEEVMFDIEEVMFDIAPVEVGKFEFEFFVAVLFGNFVLIGKFVLFEELELQPLRLAQPENTPKEEDI